MTSLEARDELDMLVAETRALILALAAGENFDTMLTDDVANALHLAIRQLQRIERVKEEI